MGNLVLVRLLSLLLAGAALLGARSSAVASSNLESLALHAGPEPAFPGRSPASVELAVRFAAPGAARDEMLQVHVASRKGRVDTPVPGLSPLQWRPGFWESTESSWSQVNSDVELGARLISPAGGGTCELWYSAGPGIAEGTATETIALGEKSDHAERVWSVSGAGASGGASFQWPLARDSAAVLEAGVGSVHVSGPLSEAQVYTQPGLRVETDRKGWASAGQRSTWIAGWLHLGGPVLSLRMGLGWMRRDSWGTHRTEPGSARWIYEGEPPVVAPDFRGETGDLEQRWAGAVLPLHLEWRPGPRLSVRAAVSAWWGALTERVQSDRRLYGDSGEPLRETVLLTESHGPACGWTWELGASFFAEDGACWRVDAGPDGRVSVSLEVRA